MIKILFEDNFDSVEAYLDDCEKFFYGNGNGCENFDFEIVEYILMFIS